LAPNENTLSHGAQGALAGYAADPDIRNYGYFEGHPHYPRTLA